jgi:hypothetical protein
MMMDESVKDGDFEKISTSENGSSSYVSHNIGISEYLCNYEHLLENRRKKEERREECSLVSRILDAL